MATSFKTSQIVLTKQLVTASGNTLLVNGVEIIGGVSGNLVQTGVQLQNIIANTGSQAWSAANNNGINLSGALTATGVALINRGNSIGSTISGNLTSTGVQLGSSIGALSGFLGNVSGGLQAQIGTRTTIITTDLISGNLIQTGVQLRNSINSLSGFVDNVSGGLQAQINSTAQIKITGSSNLALANFTGAGNVSLLVSGNSIVFISGDTSLLATIANLTATGVALINRDNSIGSTLSGNLTTTGQTLGTSLTATGALLVTTDIALSGWVNNIFVHRTGNELISGAKRFQITNLSGFYISTGSQTLLSVTDSSTIISLKNGNPIFDSNQTQLWDTSANFSLNFGSRYAQDTSATTVLDWQSKLLADTSGFNSVNWTERKLLASPGSPTVLDWGTKNILTEWQTNTTGISSGSLVNYFKLTGISGGLQAQIGAGGGATVNNLYLTGSNLYILITGLSGLKTPSNLSYTSNSFNFIVTQPITSYFYTWSGLLPTGTGFLPAASTASGMDFTIKNKVITGNRLLISGNIDNLQNLLVYSLDSFTFKSDGQTWNIV